MSEHRVVERLDRRTVGKQITLPFSKALEISIKSLRTRFRRSLITVGLIMLAIAFLMTILTSNAFQNALVKRALKPEPFGEQVLLGVGDREYVLGDDGDYYRVVRRGGPAAGQRVEVSREPVTDPEEKEVATAYVEGLEAWRSQTSELKLRLAKRVPEVLEMPETVEQGVAIGAQQWWLIGLSLAVAVVGIVNAMLMSVTERYREIGTMKCLGALDSFIIRLFLLESVFQGTAGTVVGAVLGFVLIFLRTLMVYGGVTVETFPALLIFRYGLWSVFLGFLLSVVGAILPAYRAAKMQPVEAMRVEE